MKQYKIKHLYLQPILWCKAESEHLDIWNKKELFELVVKRDNIGEAMWYIYTGLLVTSVVQLKLTTRGCNSNPKTMEDNYQKFLKEEKQSKINIDKTKTTYKL